MKPDIRSAPIGIFDSGVGGLSVLSQVRRMLPEESLLYVADQAHVPYGSLRLRRVRAFAEGIARYLLKQGAKLIVVACNTASAAGLQHLRRLWPEVPFVGMEPAVKPAAEQTRTGVVGVLATPATFQGPLFASVVERFAGGAGLLQATCPGLVSQIEKGELQTAATRRILEQALRPLLAKGMDCLVLGCTHYPFVLPLIRRIVGEAVKVIDPSPAVARQVARLLEARGLRRLTGPEGEIRLYSTGSPLQLELLAKELLGQSRPVSILHWAESSGAVRLG
jgi:glutamate racemase